MEGIQEDGGMRNSEVEAEEEGFGGGGGGCGGEDSLPLLRRASFLFPVLGRSWVGGRSQVKAFLFFSAGPFVVAAGPSIAFSHSAFV